MMHVVKINNDYSCNHCGKHDVAMYELAVDNKTNNNVNITLCSDCLMELANMINRNPINYGVAFKFGNDESPTVEEAFDYRHAVKIAKELINEGYKDVTIFKFAIIMPPLTWEYVNKHSLAIE